MECGIIYTVSPEIFFHSMARDLTTVYGGLFPFLLALAKQFHLLNMAHVQYAKLRLGIPLEHRKQAPKRPGSHISNTISQEKRSRYERNVRNTGTVYTESLQYHISTAFLEGQ